MKRIIVIGLGPGDKDSLTIGAMEELKSQKKIYTRTESHPTLKYLKSLGINYKTYDHVYEEKDSFKEVYENIVKDLVENAEKYDEIIYCVPGHPLVAERTVELLLELDKKQFIKVEVIQGLSFIEPVTTALGIDIVDGLKIVDGLNMEHQKVDMNVDNIVTQIYSKEKASELKLELSEIYGDEYEISIIKSAGIISEEKIEVVKVYELDRVSWIDHLTTIYIPKKTKEHKIYSFQELNKIMKTLRSEDGCHWDIKQTNDSLKKYVIEEAYELVDAIDNDDIDGIVEELGDILLQVVFHSQIGKEEGYFTINDVLNSISEKLIRRHPNVFKSEGSETKESYRWEEIKAEEKNQKTYSDRIKSVPKMLPSLIRSEKIQKRANKSGIDLKSKEELVDILKGKLEQLLKTNSSKYNFEKDIGDILFLIVNICGILKVDPERSLYLANEKFIDDFQKMEKSILNS